MPARSILTRPVFWIGLAIVSALSAAIAVRAFPQAFSIVALDISMDRSQALASARTIMARDGRGPADFRQAASFDLDEEAQTFVELEGGGKDAFTAMLRDGRYAAYTWRVRQFKEGETDETTISFTPDGRPYGFVERVKEDAPGAALPPAEARQIAERDAAAHWGVVWSEYRLVEQGQERRPSGRIDHTLTYERPAPTLGEGRYRLRLVVSGDRLTEVAPFVRIPEAFNRRYAAMRSANDAIGVGSVVGAAVLYGVGGIGIGLFVMMRRRWVLWRQPVFWGAVVALVQVLDAINNWPLLGMTYDTAVPRTLFFVQQIAALAGSFVGYTALFSLSFMAAETLTRRAFGAQPQLWRVWTRGPGSSREILGRTAGGFALVSVFFAYDVLLYLFATRHLGWWSPSEALLHPDVLAAYVPWFGAIASSLQAGFWEECLFRAVPLAGAALIGDRFGKRRLFLILGFIVQAVVFGSGHAPYPNQPAFARPVELIIPSIGFGLLYLYFGLLPGIILHFVFDTTWFALPIFFAHAPGIHLQQTMVVLATLTPLWVVLGRRAQAGRWTTLSAADRNADWSPPPAIVPVVAEDDAVHATIGPRANVIWTSAALIALAVCAVVTIKSRRDEGLDVSRQEAIDIATRALESRGVHLSAAWKVLAAPQDPTGSVDEFLSETAGEARRQALRGLYVSKPRWAVRVATFEGDVVNRAEEWTVFVNDRREAWPIIHTLPEARAGASLDEAAARRLADQALTDRWHFDVARGDVREISAKPDTLAKRTDWTFTFVDRTIPPLPQGEPRIEVIVAGDQIAEIGRSVHVPESWDRADDAVSTRNGILAGACGVVPGGLLCAAAIAGLIAWTKRRFSPGLFAAAMGQVFIASAIGAANGWPSILFSLSTTQPLELQITIAATVGLIGVALAAAFVALAAGMLPARLAHASTVPERDAIRLGLAAGLIAAAIAALAAAWRAPVWAATTDLSALGSLSPLVAVAIGPVAGLITRIAVIGATLAVMTHRRAGGPALALDAACLFVIGFASGGGPVGASLSGWLAAGALTGAGFAAVGLGVLLADLTMLPIALGTMTSVGLIMRGAGRPFPGAPIDALAGVIVVAAVSWWWFRTLRRRRSAGEFAAAVVAA